MVMILLYVLENTVLNHRKGTLNREKVLPLETKSTPQKKRRIALDREDFFPVTWGVEN